MRQPLGGIYGSSEVERSLALIGRTARRRERDIFRLVCSLSFAILLFLSVPFGTEKYEACAPIYFFFKGIYRVSSDIL
jgi:hypothetical protein